MTRQEKDRYIAWVGHSNENGIIWGQHERLFEFIYDEYSKTKRRFDEISIPTLSILSHAIELGLKENIKFLKPYHGSNILSEFENWTLLIKSHDLKKLSKEFKTAYYKLHKQVKASKEDKGIFVEYYKKFQTLIELLERNTETYRYAFKIDNNGNTTKESISRLKKIDFIELKELFDNAKSLLIGAVNSLGIYTDFIDYKKGNPNYVKGKGYLYCQRLHYSEHFLEQRKKQFDEQFTKVGDNKWFDTKSGENYEIEVWEENIYIIAV